MSIQLELFSFTPNPVAAREQLRIYAKVKEIPDNVSPVIDDTLGAWFDCTAMPLQDETGLYIPNIAPNPVTGAMILHNMSMTPESGYADGALQFDGVDDHAEITPNEGLQLPEYTIEMVFTMTQAPSSARTQCHILNYAISYLSSLLSCGLVYYSNAMVPLIFGAQRIAYEVGTELHFMIVKQPDSNYATAYFNCEQVNRTTVGDYSSERPFRINSSTTTPSAAPLSLKGFRLYTRALTEEERLQNYQAGMKQPEEPQTPPQPVVDESLAMWMDYTQPPDNAQYENVGVVDYIDKATGTGGYTKLYNMNGTPDSGYYQNGLRFDGVDDYGNVYTDALSTPHDSFTIETAFDVEKGGSDSGVVYWYTYNDSYEAIQVSLIDKMIILLYADDIVTIPLGNLGSNLLHIVIVGEKDSWKIYVNGVLGSEISYGNLSTKQFILSSNQELDYPIYYKTTFYTFRIYQRALNEEEINQNYEAVKASIEMEE